MQNSSDNTTKDDALVIAQELGHAMSQLSDEMLEEFLYSEVVDIAEIGELLDMLGER